MFTVLYLIRQDGYVQSLACRSSFFLSQRWWRGGLWFRRRWRPLSGATNSFHFHSPCLFILRRDFPHHRKEYSMLAFTQVGFWVSFANSILHITPLRWFAKLREIFRFRCHCEYLMWSILKGTNLYHGRLPLHLYTYLIPRLRNWDLLVFQMHGENMYVVKTSVQ